MKRTSLTLAAMLSIMPATIAHAQFGSGIVLDPTQSAHAITQIEHEERSISNQVQQISNTYGNSGGWVNSANTGNGASAAYQQVSVPRTNSMIPGYGSFSTSGQQQIAAQGATVDINDSVLTNNLETLGTIRANQTARQTDIANLEAATQTQDPSQQTIMAELQRINQALLLQLRTMQDANQINANLALQQIVAQKQQQDALKAGFQDTANYASTYQTHVAPAYNGGAQALTY